MGDETSQYYDLPALLRFGGLDIVNIAKSNSSMKVEKYNSLMMKFENKAPNAIEILIKVADRKEESNDVINLEAFKNQLEEIGSKQIAAYIGAILKAHKENNIDPAVDTIVIVVDELKRLLERIIAAKRLEKVEIISGLTEEESLPKRSYGAKLLKDALAELEQKEADRKLRVLAVDDSPVVLRSISSALGSDYKVYGMHKPTMLKNFLEQIAPDLILLDYEMPEINGFGCIPIIRSFEEHKNTPIVFLTSSGTAEHVSKALSLGASDFMVKPFQGDQLLDKVEKHIVKKKLF
jgi:CheY-like chemotaxis protein